MDSHGRLGNRSHHVTGQLFTLLISMTGSNRPRHLLVFINPFGGKKRAPKVFEKVRPFFDRAGITLDVIGEFCKEPVNLSLGFSSDVA